MVFQISELKKIGGTSGDSDAIKIGYKVVDHVFDPEILLKYTWTGVSRIKNEEKLAFCILEGIVSVFFEVLLAADDRHTKKKNEAFFKEYALKHAKKRSTRKR